MERFKKGPWSNEEDAILRDWVAAYGPQNWSCIQSKGLLMRAGKSCRFRWVNILRPGLKKGRKFSPVEEERVVKLQAQYGNKWARIAEFFPGRTDNDVKNLWSMRKKRLTRSQQGPLPSISRSQTGVHGLKPVVPPSEVSAYETLTDHQQQDKDVTENYQETMGIPCINHFFDATSGTPVLTRPTNDPINTNTTLLSAPFVEVIQREQCLNVTSAAPVLTLPTSNPPNTKSEPPAAPLNSIMPHQKGLNCTSVTPVLTVPTPSTSNIKGGPSSAPFNGTTPQIQSPFFDNLFATEPHYCFLDCTCRGTLLGPSIFDDLTASVLEFFKLPHLPDPKV